MKVTLVLISFLMAASVLAQGSSSQMLPDDHRAWEHIQTLRRARLEYPDGHHSSQPMTRGAAAAFTWQAVRDLATALETYGQEDEREWFVHSLGYQHWRMVWLAREFSAELVHMGIEPSKHQNLLTQLRKTIIEKRIGVMYPEGYFVDVQPGHWADEAIHNLRRAGVLVGYPNGTFAN